MPTKRTIGSRAVMSDEAFLAHHRPRVVECLAEARHHFVDLRLADDQRRAERDDVAGHVAQDRAVMLRSAHEKRGDGRLRIEALFGALVANKLDGTDQSDAARIADQRVIGEASYARL